ncbi:hypothetical protein RRF57_002748 [Xylaria bambusicola]|uniref:Uncharacterized protein n=1 Tax=Xylaria bambusicola TaxID=326684 RepID=A0AAN7UF36_9PEZI
MVKSKIERLRSDIPEISVLDEDDGIGRGAEVAEVITEAVGLGAAEVAGAGGLGVERTAAEEDGFVGAGNPRGRQGLGIELGLFALALASVEEGEGEGLFDGALELPRRAKAEEEEEEGDCE